MEFIQVDPDEIAIKLCRIFGWILVVIAPPLGIIFGKMIFYSVQEEQGKQMTKCGLIWLATILILGLMAFGLSI